MNKNYSQAQHHDSRDHCKATYFICSSKKEYKDYMRKALDTVAKSTRVWPKMRKKEIINIIAVVSLL
ncbi:hypothetical protein TSAR_010903 [Trichomalopsis sarcophagae]|uniref:Uncharacterized protein n=1 Tax=Trichomalopsis sarcophagae TaxID=543379 RepID=A0A232F5M3_9HYME|nr:hypothetical protein TSAR_010903 [Trichomalopsis sarcophagae]